MAEFVNQRLEEMIPELEEMSTIGLFTVKETRVILKHREGHEYKLRQQTKTKQSFLNYIQYEKKLLELIKYRRKKIGQDSKKRNVEKAIADRIHKLYRLVCERFSDDVALWEQHIDFSKHLNEKAYVSRLYNKILKIHSHNEELWVKAAQWESSREGNQNPDLSREILLKAQRVNPESQMIFLEMFRMELDLAKVVIRRKKILGLTRAKSGDDSSDEEIADDSESDFSLELKIVSIIYRKGIEMFPGNYELHLKMLGICHTVKEARELEEQIVKDLQTLYPDNPHIWNALALRYLDGLKRMDKVSKTEALRRCFASYEQALERLPNETMYSLCLTGLMALLSRREVLGTDWTVKSTLSIFEKAIQDGVLSDNLYVQLLDMLSLMGLSEDIRLVSSLATTDHPGSSQLWQARLKLMVATGQAEVQAIDSLLRDALKNIDADEAWPIWEIVLNYHGGQRSEQLDQLMEEACRNPSPRVSLSAKDWCLKWLYRQAGIKKVREFYTRHKLMRPVSLSFYKLYVQMENSQISPNFDLIRSAFEEALVTFGQKEPDLWLNYLKWEAELVRDSSRSGNIYQRALVALEPKLKETFIRKHVMLELEA